MSNLLTKLRLIQERLAREMREAEEKAQKARAAWEPAWLAYIDQAEREGLCRVCQRPLSECENKHVLRAGFTVRYIPVTGKGMAPVLKREDAAQ